MQTKFLIKEPYTLVFGEKETPVSCKQTVRYVSRAEDAINLIVRIGTPDAIHINKLTSNDTDTESFIRWIREMLVQKSLFCYPVKVTFLPEDDSKLPSYYANEVEPLMQQTKSLSQQLMDAWGVGVKTMLSKILEAYRLANQHYPRVAVIPTVKGCTEIPFKYYTDERLREQFINYITCNGGIVSLVNSANDPFDVFSYYPDQPELNTFKIRKKIMYRVVDWQLNWVAHAAHRLLLTDDQHVSFRLVIPEKELHESEIMILQLRDLYLHDKLTLTKKSYKYLVKQWDKVLSYVGKIGHKSRRRMGAQNEFIRQKGIAQGFIKRAQ
jgi:hypothetical protein